MKSIRRFTLVELLAVIALISVLSVIGFGVYSYAKGKAQETATEALLKQIDAGLEGFHTKNGYYPKSKSTGSGASEKSDFSTITFEFNDNGTIKSIDFGGEKLTRNASSSNKKERMENERVDSFTKTVDMEALKGHLDSNGVLTDAWGGKIYYRPPGQFKTGSYDLVSAGPDGAFGKNSATDPSGITDLLIFREAAGERVCDDIFTF